MIRAILRWGVLSVMLTAASGAAPALKAVPAAAGSAVGCGGSACAASPARISSEEAIARALNDVSARKDGFVLGHPRHRAAFTRDGFEFRPRRGGPTWHWQMAAAPAGVELGPVRPVREGTAIVYRRGALDELYLPGAETIEQQFVLPRRPVLHGNLVIGGRVQSAGRFRRTSDGWLWQTSRGGVLVGDVTVFDAARRKLPARMSVGRTWTRIVVDGEALATARYPVTVDPEVGANDFRISDTGGPDRAAAFDSDVAYNPTNNEYLVVWSGDHGAAPLADDEFEIFGQRLNAATGAEVGANDFRISDMGPEGNANFDAGSPAVAYNQANNEYLVVWHGNEETALPAELEIFGQRLNAATGAAAGANDFRISDMGPNGNAAFRAITPAVAYNRANNEYLVVWEGDDNTAPLVDNEFEIFGQRLNAATGAAAGANDFRISDMGPNASTAFRALSPAVTYNRTNNEYLAIWSGDDNTAPLVDDEFEIFGQRLNAATGAAAGANDFRISDMGPNGNTSFAAFPFAVGGGLAAAHNPTSNEYLVVWSGDDNTPPLVDNEFEIFGQRLNAATGAAAGANDFRISDMGPDGVAGFQARQPAVAYNPSNNEYLVVWHSDDNTPPLVQSEVETFGQRLTSTGLEVGTNDFRLSDMGPDGSFGFGALNPAVAYNSTNDEYLVAWSGDDNTPPLVADEFEIFGQRLNASTGAEAGTNDFRISNMGPIAGAGNPAVAYNSTNNEYLVVWSGDDGTPPLADDELEIFGQRLNASTGAEVGVNDFRISTMGPDGNAGFTVRAPAVAYNPRANAYLVVWSGDDDSRPLVDDEFEIFGQRLDGATGAELGANDFRISEMGPDGDTAFRVSGPDVTYNAANNTYLVVWSGDDDVDNDFEVFGQRLAGGTGADVGENDFRISNATSPVGFAAAAYNANDGEFLVVWAAGEESGAFAMFGQRLNAATGAEVGPDDFNLSDKGTVQATDVVHNTTNNDYLVVWSGVVVDQLEILGQRVDASGAELGANDFRISDVGPGPDEVVAVAYDAKNNEYLVVWTSNDGVAPFGREVLGQRLNAATGAEVGANDFALSDMAPTGSAGEDNSVAMAYSPENNEYLVAWHAFDNALASGSQIFGQRFTVEGEVGSFTFAPADAAVAAHPHQVVTFELMWIHPQRWRDLHTIDLRIVRDGAGTEPLIWLRWEEEANTFSISQNGTFKHPRTPGSSGRLQTESAFLSLAATRVTGSGPTGPSVALTLPIGFKPRAAGGTYRIEVAATDDAGAAQGFETAGTVRVTR